MVVVACCVFLWFMVVVQVVVGRCLHNLANMRIENTEKTWGLLVVIKVVAYLGIAVMMINYCGRLLWLFDDSWLWSSLLSSGIVYTSNEDIMRIIGCCPAILETVEVMVVSPQDNFHMHPLLIFRYLLFVGSVWWWLCVPQDNIHLYSDICYL